jgi:hypothetical protein
LSEKLKNIPSDQEILDSFNTNFSEKMKSQSLKLKKSDKMASSEMQTKKVNSGLNWKMTDYVLFTTKK